MLILPSYGKIVTYGQNDPWTSLKVGVVSLNNDVNPLWAGTVRPCGCLTCPAKVDVLANSSPGTKTFRTEGPCQIKLCQTDGPDGQAPSWGVTASFSFVPDSGYVDIDPFSLVAKWEAHLSDSPPTHFNCDCKTISTNAVGLWTVTFTVECPPGADDRIQVYACPRADCVPSDSLVSQIEYEQCPTYLPTGTVTCPVPCNVVIDGWSDSYFGDISTCTCTSAPLTPAWNGRFVISTGSPVTRCDAANLGSISLGGGVVIMVASITNIDLPTHQLTIQCLASFPPTQTTIWTGIGGNGANDATGSYARTPGPLSCCSSRPSVSIVSL